MPKKLLCFRLWSKFYFLFGMTLVNMLLPLLLFRSRPLKKLWKLEFKLRGTEAVYMRAKYMEGI